MTIEQELIEMAEIKQKIDNGYIIIDLDVR